MSDLTRSELLLLERAAENYVAHLRKQHGRRRRSAEATRALRVLEATAVSAAAKVRERAEAMEP